MTRPATAAVALLTLFSADAAAQRLTGPKPAAVVPAPVALDTTGMFLAKFARVGDDVFIGGQPTERALRELKEQGVTTVVNLRTPEEMTRNVRFDEAALVRSLGMNYVYIPMRGTPEFPYSPDAVTKFAEAMRSTNGKLLLHCTVAWRASHLWGAYLIKERGIPIDSALANARAINLSDERPPIEQFLDQALPTFGRQPRSP
jgi:uncharacterized protein (TIGR01244 family)